MLTRLLKTVTRHGRRIWTAHLIESKADALRASGRHAEAVEAYTAAIREMRGLTEPEIHYIGVGFVAPSDTTQETKRDKTTETAPTRLDVVKVVA